MKLRLPLCFAVALATFSPPLHPRPPLIVTGWDSPDAAQFRKHVGEFEKWGVFDGTNIKPTRRLSGGEKADAQNAFSREPWKWEEFAEALTDLRAAKVTTCRETFLIVYSNPGDVDWFDDAGWLEIVNHWRLLARLAKQGGLRGLLFDAEPYTKPHSQFRFSSQPGRAEHTFAQYRIKARERGRQIMRAVGEEFPDATIFAYRLFSDLLPLLDSGNLARALEPDVYGLLPAFVDGWLDAPPPGLSIVEGTEDIGYRANSPAEYNAAFTRQRLRLPEFLAPENREKFSRRLRIGQSLYLDAHVNPPGNPWHIDRTGSSPAGRLAANLASAFAASDGIVWLYGEQARWWPGGDEKAKSWPEKLPGAIDAIRRAKDSKAFASYFFSSKKQRLNLLSHGDFTDAKADTNLPDGWFAWQDDDSHGKITCAEGRLAISGAREAIVGFNVTTKPGTILGARVRLKSMGAGHGSILIRWRADDGKWMTATLDSRFYASTPADADGWSEITGVFEVPLNAKQAVFMAAANSQTGFQDRCEFDDAELVEIPEESGLH